MVSKQPLTKIMKEYKNINQVLKNTINLFKFQCSIVNLKELINVKIFSIVNIILSGIMNNDAINPGLSKSNNESSRPEIMT